MPQHDQLEKRRAARIGSAKGRLPLVHNMAYLLHGLALRQACISAVHHGHAQAFQFIHRGANSMKVQMHGPEKRAAREKIKPGKRNQETRLKVFITDGQLQFAHFQQSTGVLQEVRELKLSVGDEYFEPGLLVAFTRFNFLARRAFFRAMHLDLHAIRSAVNELERLGVSMVDCRDAGLSESESVEQIRHVVHQWKTPFRAPYSGGSSFLQLIVLRHDVQKALDKARADIAS